MGRLGQAACRASLAMGLAIAMAGLSAVYAQVGVQHRTGQGVVAIYDGYEVNADGTVTLWFGYLNRNYEEELSIPVGPDNTFGDAGADRGQPTHFRPRRQKAVFSVVVPEAEARSVRWTLTVRGQTTVAVATILPSSVISRRQGTVNAVAGVPANTPPVVQIAAEASTVSAGSATVIRLSATDDGYPKFGNAGVALTTRGMTVTWSKYRGPGTVAFEPALAKLPEGQGETKTRVTFSQAGEYTLMASVDDGSMNFGEYCCWANATVVVTVKPR